jgi:hypothetical protein
MSQEQNYAAGEKCSQCVAEPGSEPSRAFSSSSGAAFIPCEISRALAILATWNKVAAGADL